MAKCEICEKAAIHGNKLSITRSHISKRSPRTWKPNLQKVRVLIDGKPKKVWVSTRALKSGKVERV